MGQEIRVLEITVLEIAVLEITVLENRRCRQVL